MNGEQNRQWYHHALADCLLAFYCDIYGALSNPKKRTTH